MSWAGERGQLMEKRERERAPPEWDYEEGRKGREREERKELGTCDNVSSCSAAASLQHIWNASGRRKILQEIREEVMGVKERGPVVTHVSAIPLHRCV